MDFSSIPRALESLHRRQPPLSPHILSIANDLYTVLCTSHNNTNNNGVHPHQNDVAALCAVEEVQMEDGIDATSTSSPSSSVSSSSSSSKILQCLQALMGDTPENDPADQIPSPTTRWEALAVGLYMATELVQMTSSTSTQHPHEETKGTTNIMVVPTVAAGTSSSHTNSHYHPPVYMDGPRVPTTTTTTTTPIPLSSATSTLSSLTTHPTTLPSNGNGGSGDVMIPLTTFDTIQLLHTMHTICMTHLEHSEPRIRTLVAKAVGAYSAHIIHLTKTTTTTTNTTTNTNMNTDLEILLHDLHHMLLQSIDHHIREGRNTDGTSPEKASGTTDTTTVDSTTTTLVDDTTGWRAIETNWFCLASFIHGLSDQYWYMFPLTTNENDDYNSVTTKNAANITNNCSNLYAQLAYCGIQHVNRHVRAAAMQTYEQLIHAITNSILQHQDENLKLLLSAPSSLLRTTLIDIVKTGLADNWSQVRMASSVLCRVWFQSLQTLHIPIQDPIMMSALLPRMCLNRFYVAPGVKLYSHDTWKLIFGSPTSSGSSSSSSSSSLGLQLVAENINAMIRYYIKMCDADNHEAREAACQAIAELVVKVGTNEQYRNAAILDEQQIQNFIAVLLMCFYDEAWPVRDEACVACGVLCRAFPSACHDEIFHQTLWERIAEQLTDQIWSVRENAAVAIGDVLEAYGEEILPQVQTLIHTLLPKARDQPAMSASEYKAYMNDLNQKADSQQLYSIGSVVPKKAKSGVARFGCGDCDIDRPKAPWEATDGCIYLIREYVIRRTVPNTNVNSGTTTKLQLLPPLSDDEFIPICTELADVCRVRHFPQSDDLRATLWKCLPTIAATLGKQRFKNRYLDIFMDLLMSNLESSSASPLSHHAAAQCAEELALLIGMNMFRARLEDHHRHIFDRMVQERQMIPKGFTGGGDIFSPFGPPDSFVGMIPP